MRHLAFVSALMLLGSRDCTFTGPRPGRTVTGTWGGDNAGLIADDSNAHVHVACTFGNLPHAIVLDATGRFDLAGEYTLRAFPIVVGPPLPARFSGAVVGPLMTLTIVVTDTTADTTAVLGPVKLVRGREPVMYPCPICRSPRGRRG